MCHLYYDILEYPQIFRHCIIFSDMDNKLYTPSLVFFLHWLAGAVKGLTQCREWGRQLPVLWSADLLLLGTSNWQNNSSALAF